MIETLPDSINDVTVEATDETVIEIEESSSDVPETVYQEEETIVAESILSDISSELGVISINSADTLLAAANSNVTFSDTDLIYTLDFNGTELRVLFPENMREYLVIRDGYLINLYGSSVQGVVLSSSDQASLTTYHSQYITLYPFTSTSGNSAAYRYGAYSYLTTYSEGSYSSLNSSVEYGSLEVIDQPKMFQQFSDFQLVMMFCAALLILIQFFGGIFRR